MDENRTDISELGIDAEAPLLQAQDDPIAAAAVDIAVETELLEDDDLANRAAAEAEWLAARRDSERRIRELDARDQDRVRRLQSELRAVGAEVWPVARWWGFEVNLNEQAAVRAAELAALIGETAGAVLGGWLAPVVEWSARNKARWIASVARPYGARLVSPWTAPASLVPIRVAGVPTGDARLWWAVHEPGEGWSEDQRFVDHFTASGAALAEYRDRLYVAHRGSDGDSALWWAVYDAEQGWSEDQRFPRHFSASAPALAVYDDQLYCVHRGADQDSALWWARWDGSQWSQDARLPRHFSAGSPALAGYDGKLWCVHRGAHDDSLWWTTWDGGQWSEDQRFPRHASRSNPALAVFRGHLYCVHRGAGDDTALWWTRWDGSSWSPDERLPGHFSAEGPALTVYKDRLYVVHRGAADQSLWWAVFDGANWSADERLPGHYSAEAPAAIAYRDRNATRDQLLVLHRGSR
ncbi:hypothetical protein MF672_008315 [Actinomadura sp. ATCC 31491]|uniref:Sialidase domain-containing protein n=1 Tax=Actinomadura luzonensis TaxID=2805427 RepID=A0ABT0FN67_9ACTN|nr:hypothetical protein [Actinomadura luzonensis]MCK2213791.1 hypothetical protein [Actinomadura luzonensis]